MVAMHQMLIHINSKKDLNVSVWVIVPILAMDIEVQTFEVKEFTWWVSGRLKTGIGAKPRPSFSACIPWALVNLVSWLNIGLHKWHFWQALEGIFESLLSLF